MKNQQRPWPRTLSDGSVLDLHSIFTTIQGEGPFAGSPALFVRLAGCNLQCPACDTLYTEGAAQVGVFDLADLIEARTIADGIRLVVITGGEPFRQNLKPLCAELIRRDLLVQVETNGALPPQGFNSGNLYDWTSSGLLTIVISPKTPAVDGLLAEHAKAFKYVVAFQALAPDHLPTTALDHPLAKGKVVARPPTHFKGTIFLQPQDDQDETINFNNMRAAAGAALAYQKNHPSADVRIGVQMHKLIGME